MTDADEKVKIGLFIEYSGKEGSHKSYGRVMKVTSMGKLHVQQFFSSRNTVLGEQGCDVELFSTLLCDDVKVDQLCRTVKVRGPFDCEDDVELLSKFDFYYQLRYNWKDFSFEKDLHVYGPHDLECCGICRVRCTDQLCPSFYVTQSMLGAAAPILRFGDNVIVEEGTFIVTTEDVSQFPLRRKILLEKVAHPMLDDEQYPEAWRIPYKTAKSFPMQFKTVCRIISLTINGDGRSRRVRKQPIECSDISIEAQIFGRSTDVGRSCGCAYEVIQTNQVVFITGRDVEQIVEVEHTSAHSDVQDWIRQGVFCGKPRFHYSLIFDTKTRTLETCGPLPPRNMKAAVTYELRVEKLSTLDLFSGCGGLALGLQACGLAECKWALEKDQKAAAVFARNFPDSSVYIEDAVDWFEKLKANQSDGSLPQPGKVDLICGGPPCQGFSRLNRHKGSEKAALQRQSTNDFFDICLYLKPRYIIFENVAAFATNQGGANMQAALAGLVKSSYQVRFGVLRAGAHGVPQNRNRIFILAAAMSEKLPRFPLEKYTQTGSFPTYTVGSQQVKSTDQGPVLYHSMCVMDAISDLQDIPTGKGGSAEYGQSMSVLQNKLRENSKELLLHNQVYPLSELNSIRARYIPQGGDWRWVPNVEIVGLGGKLLSVPLKYSGVGKKKSMCKCKRLQRVKSTIPWGLAHTASRNNHWSGALGRLQSSGQFPTIITQLSPLKANGRIIHPTKDRFVTIREAARAQTFPDSFHFDVEPKAAMRQIGNAVPPVLAEALGFEILHGLKVKF